MGHTERLTVSMDPSVAAHLFYTCHEYYILLNSKPGETIHEMSSRGSYSLFSGISFVTFYLDKQHFVCLNTKSLISSATKGLNTSHVI